MKQLGEECWFCFDTSNTFKPPCCWFWLKGGSLLVCWTFFVAHNKFRLGPIRTGSEQRGAPQMSSFPFAPLNLKTSGLKRQHDETGNDSEPQTGPSDHPPMSFLIPVWFISEKNLLALSRECGNESRDSLEGHHQLDLLWGSFHFSFPTYRADRKTKPGASLEAIRSCSSRGFGSSPERSI